MASIHPTSGDLFYLRLILKNRAGALSFDDLKTVDGVEHETYHSACVSLELCENDKQWIDSLNDAVDVAHPRAIRGLFCNIVLHCVPARPGELYEIFKEEMSSDFFRTRSLALNLTAFHL